VAFDKAGILIGYRVTTIAMHTDTESPPVMATFGKEKK